MMEIPIDTRQRIHETSPINVFLVDEQVVFIEGMRKLFEAEPDFNVVGSACDPHHAARLVQEHKPDVVIASLKGRALVRLANRLRYHTGAGGSNDVPLVVLTTASENSHLFRTSQCGIAGILHKDASPQQLFENVRSVVADRDSVAGKPWATGTGGLDHVTHAADTPPSVLTPRELQIVESVGRGDTNSAIARQLTISQDTVKQHLTRIFDKLGVSNRLQLALYALDPSLSDDFEVDSLPPMSKYQHH
jgi:DNA-binding NarL/FixJ family response regulator